MNNPITQNEKTAIRRLRSGNKPIVIGGETKYIVQMQHNIGLVWIDPEDVNKVLAIQDGCCGNLRAGGFRLATDEEVRRWQFGGR